MTTQQHHPQYAEQAPPAAPPPPAPAATKPATPRRSKEPAWYAKPHVVAVVALIVALVEMLAFGLLGWVWALAVNVALAFVLFAAALAWRRKGKGGLLDKLLKLTTGRSRNSGAGRGGAGSRTGRTGSGLWSGRGGRKASGTGGGRMAGLRSKLPRVLGGTKGRSGPASGAGAGRKPGGVLGRLAGRKKPGGAGAGGSGRGGSPSGRRGLFGRKKSSGGTGDPGGRSSRRGRKSGNGGKSTSGSGPGGSRTPWWKPGGRKKQTLKPSGKGPATSGGGAGRPSGVKPPAGHDGKRPATGGPHDPKKPGRPDAAGEPDPQSPRPAGGPSSTGGSDDMTEPGGIKYNADQSLQRAGANLGSAEEAAAEVQRLYALAEAAKNRFNEAFSRATTQMETELPASARLNAEMEATKAQASRATTADEWRAVSANAATLPATYKKEHEVDEERLAGGRGGRHKEKRADVSYAEQDN